MKKTILIALASFAAIGAQAGVISNVGTTQPTGTLTGFQNVNNQSREVIRTSTQSFTIGQSFTLSTLAPTEDYKLTDIYLKSASGEDWDNYTGNMQIKVFSGSSGSASLLGTYSYDLNAAGNGTGTTDVINQEWVKFGLDAGLVLADGGSYSFLVYFDTQDDDHKWAFRRDNSGGYAGGNQFEGTSYVASDWTSAPWNGVSSLAARDLAFHVDGSVIPEPATLGLVALVGTSILFVRRRLIM